MISKLHVIVWGGGRGASEPVSYHGRKFNNQISSRAGIVFQDAGLVTANALELASIEQMQPLIVRDVDARANVRLRFAKRDFNTKLFSLSNMLMRDAEWRENQDIATSCLDDLLRPDELLWGFSEAAVLQ